MKERPARSEACVESHRCCRHQKKNPSQKRERRELFIVKAQENREGKKEKAFIRKKRNRFCARRGSEKKGT